MMRCAGGIGLALGIDVRFCFFILSVLILGATMASAETDLGVESHAGLGVSSGNGLMPPGSLVTASSISLLLRRGRVAAELNSSLYSGQHAAYWSLGPGLRYYLPLASTVRNRIDVRLSAFARLGTSRVVRTENGLLVTARGRSLDSGAGVQLDLSPLDSMVVTQLQLAGAGRYVSMPHGPGSQSASGTLSAVTLGFSFGCRF
jgi:hypothetical protein